jgi:choline dehydrogenase-like flavoprotein
MPQKFDFVIVGGGTSGCLLASRLSHARSAPSVLLLETGDSPSGDFLHAPFHRFHAVALRPDLDHGYTSEPEAQLHNRSIGYQRGKGLGGSSVLNFAVYLRGSREDYDRWGTLVGDEDWEWKSVKESFKRIESYDGEGSKGYKQFAEPGLHEHGTEGGLCVGLPPVLEEGVLPQMEALAQLGESINQDVNDGDPMGVSVFPQSYGKGGRSTSAAFLLDPPPNLEVWTGAKVEKLVWEGARVVGVVTEGGREGMIRIFPPWICFDWGC